MNKIFTFKEKFHKKISRKLSMKLHNQLKLTDNMLKMFMRKISKQKFQ